MTVMTPLSGAPAAPGLTITAQPMLTGGPGISSSLLVVSPGSSRRRPSRGAEVGGAGDGGGGALELRLPLPLDGGRGALQRGGAGRLDVDGALGLEVDVAARLQRDGAVGLDG